MRSKSRTRVRKQTRPNYASKVGQPPGSLIHVGEIKTDQPAITLFEFDSEGFNEKRFESIEESRQYRPHRKVLWLNVYGLQQPEVMAEIGKRFGLHPLALEDILNAHQRPKLDDYGNYLFMVLRAWRRDEESNELVSDQVSIVLGEHFLLSFQERPSGLFEPLRERMRKGAGTLRNAGPDYLAYSLLDAVVDRYFTVLELIANRCDHVEDELGVPRQLPVIADINRLKHDVRDLRRTVWPVRDLLAALQRSDERLVKPATTVYLRDVYDHIVQVVEGLDSMRDSAGDLLDLHLSLESQRLNAEVRKLTLLSVLFMPATLVSGIFGMNFHFMPWLTRADGFDLAIVTMLGAAAGMGLLYVMLRRAAKTD
ncbi:magnesium/cobalt transporter CorA [Niveibacterium sp. SC-1]|uniref:magnesium/cobalt transporter CorA n=1 Tax=Niveibacterium sp. SC-1 TaxID=3135646 RepID=UPI0031200A25